ncbi:MAG TPA: SDR family oxidoreductase [Verrucomicrobiales bacterium]|jgi:NAD(P)-dependent dehydrogenase (short-subunit alcohol dehydrogenase family)|nr:SDR family oxidoreductase [Verrucomicrobiales bacterium]
MALYSDLRGSIILVTGGANGIGEAMVRAFHSQDAEVYFCDLDKDKGARLSVELGEGVFFRKVDLTKEREICHWIEGIGRNRERIDCVVNNAARDPRIPIESMDSKQWDNLFQSNLKACFLTCRESLKWMKGPHGSIINFSSITFHIGPSDMSAYVATKGGVIGFTRALAREVGPRGIRVNTLSPGWVMTERQLKEFVNSSVKRQIKKDQCVPKLIQTEEIAEVALFLAAEASRAITGQEILADRGWAYS